MMSLIPVVALPLQWDYFCDGFVIVRALASDNVAYHSWVIFGVFFVCIVDIVNMVTLLLQVCHGTHCEVAIALMFHMPGEFNMQYYFVVHPFMLQWWW